MRGIGQPPPVAGLGAGVDVFALRGILVELGEYAIFDRRRRAAELPLGRFGEPEEVAAAVAFLASDDASFFVGETVSPNGGIVTI